MRRTGSPATGAAAARHHQGVAHDRVVPLGGLVPGDHQGAHRGGDLGQDGDLHGLKENVIMGRLIPAGHRAGPLQEHRGSRSTRRKSCCRGRRRRTSRRSRPRRWFGTRSREIRPSSRRRSGLGDPIEAPSAAGPAIRRLEATRPCVDTKCKPARLRRFFGGQRPAPPGRAVSHHGDECPRTFLRPLRRPGRRPRGAFRSRAATRGGFDGDRMPTIQQLVRNGREQRRKRSKSADLERSPQKRAACACASTP